jgi:hypothetical protein
MKKLIIISLLFLYSTGYSQYKDTSDYFTLGIYGGSFQGNGYLNPNNNFINSVAAEIEYFKLSDMSFSFNILYQFSNYKYPFKYTDTRSYKIVPSLIFKYYLRKKSISPYLQAGILYEFDIYNIKTKSNYTGLNFAEDNTYVSNILYISFGLGLNIRITDRLSIDGRLLVNPRITNNDVNHLEYIGGTGIAGVKYYL